MQTSLPIHSQLLGSKRTYYTLSAIRSFRRFCKQFSESSPCLPGEQGSCKTTVELSENILQNLGNDLMVDSVRIVLCELQPRVNDKKLIRKVPLRTVRDFIEDVD